MGRWGGFTRWRDALDFEEGFWGLLLHVTAPPGGHLFLFVERREIGGRGVLADFYPAFDGAGSAFLIEAVERGVAFIGEFVVVGELARDGRAGGKAEG